MPSPRVIATAAAALAAALLAGCGDADVPARARDGRVAIVLDDFMLRPQTVRAPAGRITLELVNRGRVGHNFRVRQDKRELVKVLTLLPGERASETVELEAGDYRMFCSVNNYEELGMYGTLTLR